MGENTWGQARLSILPFLALHGLTVTSFSLPHSGSFVMKEKKFYRRPTLPLELLLGQPRSQAVWVLNVSLRWQAWTLREPSTLPLMSCWTMTSSASYSPSRSLDLQVWPLSQDSSNFYLVMSARDDRDLVNCQGPCHQVFLYKYHCQRVCRATGRSSGLEAQPVRTLAQFSATRSGSSTRWWTRPRCCGRQTSRRQVVGGRGTVTGSTSSIGRRWYRLPAYFFPLKTQASLLMCYLFFQIGLIRLKLWEGAQLIADSGNIIGYNWNKDRIWQKKQDLYSRVFSKMMVPAVWKEVG